MFMHQVWCGHRASSLLGTPLGEELEGRVATLGLAHRGPDLSLCRHPFPGKWVRPGCPGQPARASGPLPRVPRAKCAPAAYPLFRCWGRCEGSRSEHSTPDCGGRNTFLLGIPPTVHTHTQARTPLPGSLSQVLWPPPLTLSPPKLASLPWTAWGRDHQGLPWQMCRKSDMGAGTDFRARVPHTGISFPNVGRGLWSLIPWQMPRGRHCGPGPY